ncbi:hypothetical protein PSTG_08598 [Puccinia striiformis f. sp. tritici PST-78]|uniref:Uncharacterized protein n=1 Tax=Puccinia striiformis f. sp. tritici PST-78 TaxID=1165861 RepID=A0A0L0VGL6_9BASI|nr:hypothetical protein PSTG_08598 [Puccinia striiformis f. sp. tritici PST-78]
MYQLIHPSSVVQILADLSGTGPARIKPRASRYGRWGRLKSTVSLSVYFEMEGPMPQARVSISWPGDASPAVDTPKTRTSTDALLPTATQAISNIMFVTFFVLATVTLIAFKYLSQNQTNFKQENLMLKKMNEEKDLQLDRVLEDNKQLKADNRKLTKLEKDLERDRVLEDNKQLKADNRELTKLISAGSLIGQVSETWFTRSIPFLLFSIFLLLLLSFFV